MAPITYGSVCSGIEGASVAWAPLGWRCAFMAEVEPFPRAVLKHHYPDVPLFSDFTHLRDRHRDVLLEADVLVGGTPCQGFSVAGLRGSLSDDRSNLCLEFIRLADAIDDLRRAAGRPPCWILWENVPGVFSTEDNAFGAFLGGLVGGDAAIDAGPRGRWTDAGVAAGPERVAAWRVLDAQHFGLAQRRRRVFVLAVGGAGAWRCPDALLPLADCLQGYPAPRRQARERVAPTISARASAGGGLGTDFDLDGGLIDTAPTITAAGGTERKHGQGWGQREYEKDGFLQVDGGFDDGSVGSVTSKWAKRTGGYAGAEHYNLVAHALRASEHASHRDDSDTYIAHALRADGFDASEDGTGRGTPLVAAPLMARSSRGGGQTNSPGYQADEQIVVTHTLGVQAGQATEDGTGRGAPLVAFTPKDSGADLSEDISPTLRAGAHASSHANGGVGPAVLWPPELADPISASEAKTYTHEGANFRMHNVVPVAIPITADAMRRGEGTALTPSPDAAGRARLRDPGLGIGEDGDPAPTLQAAGPGAVFTLASRGRGDGHQLEFRDDELANAILTPSGGRAGIGVGAVAYSVTPESGQRADLRATEVDVAPTIRAAEGTRTQIGTHIVETPLPGFINPRQLRSSESSNQVGIKPDADVADALCSDGPGAVFASVDLYNADLGGETSGTLKQSPYMQQQGVLAFTQNSRAELRLQSGNGEVTGTLQRPSGNQQTYLAFAPAEVVNGNSTPETATDLAFPLRADDGSGNRQAIAVTPFDPRQLGSEGNWSEPKPGDPSHPLRAVANAEPAVVVTPLDRQNAAVGKDVAGTLNTDGRSGDQAVAFNVGVHKGWAPLDVGPNAEQANALTAARIQGVAFRTNQTGAQGPIFSEEVTDTLAQDHPPAVAFNITPSQGNVDYNARPTDRAQALTGNGNRVSARGGDVVTGITLHGSQEGTVSTASETELAAAIRARSPGQVENSATTAALHGSMVRRLTPVECERLQGFPDGYTDVPFRGKPASDGPRYKALGNSFAAPVIRWIGERIASVR